MTDPNPQVDARAANRELARNAVVRYCEEQVGVGGGLGFPTAVIHAIADAFTDAGPRRA